MRLIDADKLKEYLDRKYSFGIDLKFMLLDEIDNQPTAYDIDKVVKELEVLINIAKSDYDLTRETMLLVSISELKKAIEIVEQTKAEVIEEILKKITTYIDDMKDFYTETQDNSILGAIVEVQKIRRMIRDMSKEQNK